MSFGGLQEECSEHHYVGYRACLLHEYIDNSTKTTIQTITKPQQFP